MFVISMALSVSSQLGKMPSIVSIPLHRSETSGRNIVRIVPESYTGQR